MIDNAKAKISNIWRTVKSRPKTSIAAVLALVAIIFFVKGGDGESAEVVVKQGTVTAEVAVTGKTVAVNDVDLAFELTGKIASINARVGDRVEALGVLATLDNSELIASRARARANLEAERVKLAQIKVTSGLTYSDTRQNMVSAIKEAYIKADDAIRNNIDTFFENKRQQNTYIDLYFVDGNSIRHFDIDGKYRTQINRERRDLEKVLTAWNESIKVLDENDDFESFIVETKVNLDSIKSFLNIVSLAINSIEVTELEYQAVINGYKTSVSEARSLINQADANLLSAQEKLSSAPRTIGGDTFDEVLIQEAVVAQYAAELASVEAKIAQTVIRAPFAGLVTRQDREVGEIVASGDEVISLISDQNLEIEANVSEVNIGKIALGNPVSITFDAFPDRVYTGEVIYIEPAETIIADVVNYKVKIRMEGEDMADLKSGLTANLRMNTAARENVLYIPEYAIFNDDGKSFVLRRTPGGEPERVEIMTGLRGSNGTIEVISGLSAGDTLAVELK